MHLKRPGGHGCTLDSASYRQGKGCVRCRRSATSPFPSAAGRVDGWLSRSGRGARRRRRSGCRTGTKPSAPIATGIERGRAVAVQRRKTTMALAARHEPGLWAALADSASLEGHCPDRQRRQPDRFPPRGRRVRARLPVVSARARRTAGERAPPARHPEPRRMVRRHRDRARPPRLLGLPARPAPVLGTPPARGDTSGAASSFSTTSDASSTWRPGAIPTSPCT